MKLWNELSVEQSPSNPEEGKKMFIFGGLLHDSQVCLTGKKKCNSIMLSIKVDKEHF